MQKLKERPKSIENILDQFQKLSCWQFLKLVKDNGLKLKELNGDKWRELKTWKGNFEQYHKPILLHDKINGKMKATAIGFYKINN